MSRGRTLLIVIAALAIADVVGAVLLHKAWQARSGPSVAGIQRAAFPQPASAARAGGSTTVRTGS